MIPQWLIEKKRDGVALTPAEISAFVAGFAAGTIPDYQMAALAMAIYFQGMDGNETAALTEAMMRSGELISFADWPRPTADKHSTGGIGDKLSLMIAPLAAASGLAVPMIAGRGLGITGGTVDKLEAIPGYNTNLTVDEFKAVIDRVGCAIIGQTATLAPADRKLYALRDVTGTVSSIPLITSSIMSKKLAEGSDTLVLDVKCGRAAFMPTLEQARALASSLLQVGRALGRKMGALISEMSQPLGRTVGNAVEVREAIETLRGAGPADTRLLTIELTALMCQLAGIFDERQAARQALAQLLDDGSALAVFARMVSAQGGNAGIIETPELLPQARVALEVPALADGYVADVDARALGRLVVQLGGGRRLTDDVLDLSVGIDELVQAGEAVAAGQPLMRILAADRSSAEALLATAQAAVTLADTPPPARQLIIEEVF